MNTKVRALVLAVMALVITAAVLAGCSSPTWKIVKPTDPPQGCEELRKRTGDEKAC